MKITNSWLNSLGSAANIVGKRQSDATRAAQRLVLDLARTMLYCRGDSNSRRDSYRQDDDKNSAFQREPSSEDAQQDQVHADET